MDVSVVVNSKVTVSLIWVTGSVVEKGMVAVKDSV